MSTLFSISARLLHSRHNYIRTDQGTVLANVIKSKEATVHECFQQKLSCLGARRRTTKEEGSKEEDRQEGADVKKDKKKKTITLDQNCFFLSPPIFLFLFSTLFLILYFWFTTYFCYKCNMPGCILNVIMLTYCSPVLLLRSICLYNKPSTHLLTSLLLTYTWVCACMCKHTHTHVTNTQMWCGYLAIQLRWRVLLFL